MEECFLDFIFFKIGFGHLFFSGGESNCFFEQLKTRKKNQTM